MKSQRLDVKREKENKSDWSLRVFFTFYFSLTTCCLLFIGFCLLFLSGCDEPFQPIRKSDTAPFSMYGYLDVSADTQWLQVTPVRDQLDTPPDAPDMHVTLTDRESGNSVAMNDSVFRLTQGFNALNVWTAMDIKPDRTYRLKAERPDGAASQVTVPEDFPTPVLKTIGLYKSSADLYLKDLERVADVQTIWQMEGRIYLIPYRFRIRTYRPASYDYIVNLSGLHDVKQIFVNAPPPWPEDVLQGGGIKRQVFVASGGPEWREDITSVEDIIYSLPEGVSNVENGLGYVIGIVSKTIPMKLVWMSREKLLDVP